MATEKLQVYQCGVCGNTVAVLGAGAGELTCCKQAMTLQAENTTDAAQEKHVPVIEKVEGGVKVTVGSVAHPMADDHYIAWIALTADGRRSIEFLNPGDAPEVIFPTDASEVTARAFCNLHGLWKSAG